MRLPAAERADIETPAPQRLGNGIVVDLRVMRHGDERRIGVQRTILEDIHRPIRRQIGPEEPFRRGESRARIDDPHIEAGKRCHLRQDLTDVNGADNHDMGRRQMHVKKVAMPIDLDCRRFP